MASPRVEPSSVVDKTSFGKDVALGSVLRYAARGGSNDPYLFLGFLQCAVVRRREQDSALLGVLPHFLEKFFLVPHR